MTDKITPAAKGNSDQMPVLEFDPRTGAPLFPPEYYNKPHPENEQLMDDSLSSTNVGPQKSSTPHRGMWLSRKLQGLYNDEKYKSGSAEFQKSYREKAYDLWVAPYYKSVLKADPPTKDDWVNNTHKDFARSQFFNDAITKDKVHALSVLEETIHVMAGIQSDLQYVGKGLDYWFEHFSGPVVPKSGDQKIVKRIGPAEKLFKSNKEYAQELEHYYQDRIDNLEGGKKKDIVEKIGDKVPAFVTDAVFFEALGGAKATKALRISYPKAANFVGRRAIDSLNGAIDFAIWNKTTGESGVSGLGYGAVFGPVVSPILNTIFRFGGQESVKRVVNDAVEKASQKTVKAAEEVSSSVVDATKAKAHPSVEKATQIITDEMNSYSKEKFGKEYSQLAYIQKVHVNNKLLGEVAAATKAAEREGLPKEVIQTVSKEEQETIEKIFPEAKKAQQSVDQFLQQQGKGKGVVSTKLLATLPHHNTTIESSWRDLQARASFLKNAVKRSQETLAAGVKNPQRRAQLQQEVKALNEALNEEFKLMKEKAEKQRKKEGGFAFLGKDPRQAINKRIETLTDSPKAQPDNRGDYKINFLENPDRNGFIDWYNDGFARGIAKHFYEGSQSQTDKAAAQTLLNHYHSIDNSFLIASNLAKQARMGEGYTKQLFHPQYGLVGGINYSFEGAGSLGEHSGFSSKDKVLYINYLGARPNVVARVWNAPGVGQSLFVDAAQEAYNHGTGIALIPYDQSVPFYKKMGMHFVGNYMAMTKNEVGEFLKNKGLLMMLLGGGITYGVSQSDLNMLPQTKGVQ